MKFYIINLLSLCFSLLMGCSSSVLPVGELGPKKLQVYSLAQNDFLSASRMLVILNQKGDVVAYTGGTVAGAGAIGLQTGASVATAAAVLYGSKSIEHGLEHAKMTTKGIPSHIDVNAIADATLHLH